MTNVYGWESQANAYRQEAIDKQNQYNTQMQNVENDPQIKNLKDEYTRLSNLQNLKNTNEQEYVNQMFRNKYGAGAKDVWNIISHLPPDDGVYYFPDRHNWYSPLKNWQTSAPQLYALLSPYVRYMGFGNYGYHLSSMKSALNNEFRSLASIDLTSQVESAKNAYEQASGKYLTNVNTVYGTASTNASTNYNNLKFSREDAMKAISSGRLQERLVNSPYKIL